MKGYPRFIWSSLLRHPLWLAERFTKGQAWVDLILMASHEDHVSIRGPREVKVQRGEVLTSQVELASRWRWNRETVKGFLRLLGRQGMTSIRTSKETETGYTIIQLLNYEGFQNSRKATVEPPSAIRTSIGHTSENREAPKKSAIRSAIESSPKTQDILQGCEHPGDSPPASDPPSEPASGIHPIRHYPSREFPRREYKNLAGDSAPAGTDAPRKPAKENGRTTDPNVKLLIDAYHQSFLERHGTPPPISGGKCGQIAKTMLRGRPVEEALWVVENFFQNPPAFYRDKGLWGLEHVLAAMPTLLARRAELERGA